MRRGPLGGHGFFWSKADILLLHLRGGARDFDRASGGGFHSRAGQVLGSGESPRSIGNYTHADPHRFGVRRATDFAVLRSERAATLTDDARIGVARATHICDVQSPA